MSEESNRLNYKTEIDIMDAALMPQHIQCTEIETETGVGLPFIIFLRAL